MQKSQRASRAALNNILEDSTFHTEQVSATLTGWNFDGSIAMKRPAVQVREARQFGLAAK